MTEVRTIDRIVGLTIKQITGLEKGSERVIFHFGGGKKFHMYHEEDCCEQVRVEDIIGDPNDLRNARLCIAEEVTSQEELDGGPFSESWTWTFYKFATIKGYVTIRWLGESNGYYSERVAEGYEGF